MDIEITLGIVSIIAGVVSIVLGILAVALAIYFFVQSRNSEHAVGVSLAKIETQAELLQKLNTRQLDRMTRYLTDRRGDDSQIPLNQVLQLLIQLPQQLTGSFSQATSTTGSDQLLDELLSAYIAIYFYVAQTNFWAQQLLPDESEFDESSTVDSTVKRIVDLSAADFDHMAQILTNCDYNKLKANQLSQLMSETMVIWKDAVRDSSAVFEARKQQKNQ